MKTHRIRATIMLLLGGAALALTSCECCTSEKEEAMIRELRMEELRRSAPRTPNYGNGPAA
jgi:hypothetical protein